MELWNQSRSSPAEWVNANASSILLFEDAETDGVEGSGDRRGEDAKLVGFDSFEGLSSDWSGSNMLAGTFSTGGVAPIVSEKVTLVKGDVRQTVQIWLGQNDLKEYCHRLLHLDLDLYEPTYSVLRTIAPYLADGDLILFYTPFPTQGGN